MQIYQKEFMIFANFDRETGRGSSYKKNLHFECRFMNFDTFFWIIWLQTTALWCNLFALRI